MSLMIGTPPATQKLTLLASATFTAATEATVSGIPASTSMLYVEVDITSGGATGLYVQFNGDTAGNYGAKTVAASTVTTSTGGTTVTMASGPAGVRGLVNWYMPGTSPAVAGGKISLCAGGSIGAASSGSTLVGEWTAGNATAITSMRIQFGASAAATGTIRVYAVGA